MNRIITIIGLIATAIGAIDVSQIVNLTSPEFGAVIMVVGALLAGAGRALRAHPPKGIITIGAILVSIAGTLATVDLFPLLGTTGGVLVGVLGAVGAALSQGWAFPEDSK